MSLAIRIAGLLPVAAVAVGCATAPAVVAHGGDDRPELVGPLSRAEIEAGVPDWVAAQIESAPDADQAARMAAAGEGSRVTVYLGTWCSDSRRELSRFWRAIDEAGGEVAFELAYIGIRRDKEQRDPALQEVGLQFVPTFVVERDGVELGRMVEVSPNGIEYDLAALLEGELTGVVSAREDLRP